METVGIKELKAHLSHYLGKARSGATILITDRGQAVAELHPLSQERQVLQSMAAQGRLRWAGGKPKGLAGEQVQGREVSEIVLEDRR